MTRRIEVAPERLAGWCAGFADRHGGVTRTELGPDRWRLYATDRAVALLEPPFPPVPGQLAAGVPGLAIEPLVAHALVDRTVGVLLVRLGAHAAGIFEGARLVESKVDRTLVQGRHKAGG
ncbi:MAG TPA: Vms1/Ankzf1 family peptidyl-tRNA hydrolase, partial [Actinomycetes bacterium]|nr:Vms1/Ankzf1 family peptidyl-tRNA hydrolase [Actinomycetes bacterium]